MKPLIFILLVTPLLVIPISFASFNCSLTINPQQCINITNSNMNESQKDQLLSALLYNYDGLSEASSEDFRSGDKLILLCSFLLLDGRIY